MQPLLLFIQASLIFFTSATAIQFFGMRLSDVAVFLFSISIVFSGYRKMSGDLIVSFLLLCVLITILLSSFYAIFSYRLGVDLKTPNLVAVPFGVILSLCCIWLMNSRQILGVVSWYSGVAVFLCSFLLVWEQFFGKFDWVVVGEEFDRFSALSQNPNQLALYLLPIPFLSIISFLSGVKRKWLAIFEIALVFFVNFFMLGKAVFIAWGVSAVFLFFIGWVWFGDVRLRWMTLFWKVAFLSMLSPLVLFVVNALYKGDTAGSQEGQGDVRVRLWMHGIEAWSDSVVFGHGPGHYSGLDSAYENMEAHNFLIDWISAYGLIGGLVLIAYFSWLILFSFKRKAWIVLALYISLLVQITFHFYGRQPLFWMLLVFGYIVSASGGFNCRNVK